MTMSSDTLVFGLWVACFVLVVWQVVLTVELTRLRNKGRGAEPNGVEFVNLGLLYNGLIDEFRETADEKIALLETRIEELEGLLDDGYSDEQLLEPERVRWLDSRVRQLRRCG